MINTLSTSRQPAEQSPAELRARIAGPYAKRLAILAVAALAGCSSGKEPPPTAAAAPPPTAAAPPPPPPTSLDLTIRGGADLNPSPTGRPSPVMVDLYQLSSSSAFSQADFFDLAEGQVSALAADTVARRTFSLSPGGEERITEILSPAVTHIGIMAAYRDIQNAAWRVTIAVPNNVATVAIIEAGATGLSAATSPIRQPAGGAPITWSSP
jgi:type VI secretion system protein VasD